MRRAILIWPIVLLLAAGSAIADARLSVLVDVLKLPEAARILSEEGLDHAQDLNEEMLGGEGGPGWQIQVERVYDPARMVELVRSDLGDILSPAQMEEVTAFYASDLGSRIITLENEARKAIQDPEVEAAARARYESLLESGEARLTYITQIIESGDMITRNVTSAMNSNYQFLRGLVEGDAIEMSEDEILDDVSGDIEENTADTTGWLNGYLLLAYHPLTDAELETYIVFSDSDAGRALNRALFSGFGKAYEDISYALGRAVALNMTSQDL